MTMRRHGAKNADYRGGVTCLYDTQLLVPACMHPSAVAVIALGPSGACQTYQSPPQPPGPRRGGWLSALSAQPLSTGGCVRVCLGFWVLNLLFWGRKESGLGLLTVSDTGLIFPESGLPMATGLSYLSD